MRLRLPHANLLVVVLCVAALAAFATPALLERSSAGERSEARATLRIGAAAMETYARRHAHSYANATLTALRFVEPRLPATGLRVIGAPAGGYTLTLRGPDGETFTYIRDGSGSTWVMPCEQESVVACSD